MIFHCGAPLRRKYTFHTNNENIVIQAIFHTSIPIGGLIRCILKFYIHIRLYICTHTAVTCFTLIHWLFIVTTTTLRLKVGPLVLPVSLRHTHTHFHTHTYLPSRSHYYFHTQLPLTYIVNDTCTQAVGEVNMALCVRIFEVSKEWRSSELKRYSGPEKPGHSPHLSSTRQLKIHCSRS